MAKRGGGIRVFLKKVVRGRTRAFPYLAPSLKLGEKALRAGIKRIVATLPATGFRPITVKRKLDLAVETAANVTKQAAQRKVQKRSRNLERSINARRIRPMVWSVGTGLPYGRYLEEGTKGGKVIRPKSARVLSFVWANAPAGVRRRFKKKRGGRRR
jgi:hypothetical protein